MKKLFTLIALIGFAFGANAQRYCDIAVTTVKPVAGSTLSSGTNFDLQFTIKNLGPDSLKTTDTLGFIAFLGTTQYPLGTYTLVHSLHVGDSAGLDDTAFHLTWTGYASDSIQDFCFAVIAFGSVGDSLADTNLNNNISCNSVTALDIRNLIANKTSVKTYPNPAQSQVNFAVNTTKPNNVAIRVMDALGRIVINENEGRIDAGQHDIKINTGNLQNGMYIYQVTIGNETKNGKLYIAK